MGRVIFKKYWDIWISTISTIAQCWEPISETLGCSTISTHKLHKHIWESPVSTQLGNQHTISNRSFYPDTPHGKPQLITKWLLLFQQQQCQVHQFVLSDGTCLLKRPVAIKRPRWRRCQTRWKTKNFQTKHLIHDAALHPTDLGIPAKSSIQKPIVGSMQLICHKIFHVSLPPDISRYVFKKHIKLRLVKISLHLQSRIALPHLQQLQHLAELLSPTNHDLMDKIRG